MEDCVPFLTEQGMPEQEARALLEAQLPPGLKRWSTTAVR